jgi:hypothetical protein
MSVKTPNISGVQSAGWVDSDSYEYHYILKRKGKYRDSKGKGELTLISVKNHVMIYGKVKI